MPKFNINDYEPVEERLARAVADHDDLRIITECVIPGTDGKWLFKATIYLTAGDQAAELPKATGWASEIEQGPQADFKAELGETSAIGRCLANFGYTGNKKSKTTRMTKEEAQKASNTLNGSDWISQAGKLQTVSELRKLWNRASAAGADQKELDEIARIADQQSATSQPKRVS